MFTVEQIRQVRLFREAHDDARRRGFDDRIARHHVVRVIIERCVLDLMETTREALESRGVASAAEVRAVGRRLVSYSEPMATAYKACL